LSSATFIFNPLKLNRGETLSLSPRKGSEVMPQGKEIKMNLHTVWDLELLHHLILRLKEAKYDLGSVVGILLSPSQETFYRRKGLLNFSR